MLTATGLCKSYPKHGVVLDGVDVELQPGTVTALLGANGCGKSTLLRAIALIESADRGIVNIDGTTYRCAEISRNDPRPWPTITVVFQQLFLWPHLTVRENITLPQSQHREPNSLRRFDDLAQTFDLTAFADRYPNELSLGERQRVALARAQAVRPRYLLLDEVTSALDIEHITSLRRHLMALRNEGLAILLVTHLIGFARDVADRVLFMAHGGIAERGDAGILSAPQSPALARFLSVLDASMAGAVGRTVRPIS